MRGKTLSDVLASLRGLAYSWRMCASFFGTLLCVVLSGCETMNGLSCGGGGQRAVQELVYFGTDTPSGSVTPEDWTRFLSDAVTPRFPEGLSAWQASGQWRSASGQIIREPSFVLSLIHPDDSVPNGAVQEIIASYKTRFQQEAVLRVTTIVCTSL
jgi:Protein of unknown function (DUF3574)